MLLFIAVVIEKRYNNNKINIISFFSLSTILTIVSAFRYGSGSDYFGYMWHYTYMPSNIMQAISSESHMNFGFKIAMSGCKYLGLSYEVFIILLSVSLMTIMIYLIWKYSNNKSLSLVIFYTIYYHIYINSAIRQGVTLVIFLWAFFTFLRKNKVWQYCLVIVIGSLFHYSILITLIIPIIKIIYEKFGANKRLNTIFIIIAICSLIFRFERILPFIAKIVGIGMPYESTSPSIMAIILRIVLLVFILLLYKFSDKKNITEFDKFQIYTYFIGVILFIAVANTPELSRLTEFFSILDIFIIGNLINAIDLKLFANLGLVFTILLVSVIFIKDQSSFIYQGSYYYDDVFKYPYVTIFNKEDIFEYRYVENRYRPNEYKYWVSRYRNNVVKWNLMQEQKRLRGEKVEPELPIPNHKIK